MIAVSGNERIFRFGGSHTTGCNGFLPDIGMEKTADLSFHFIFLFGH